MSKLQLRKFFPNFHIVGNVIGPNNIQGVWPEVDIMDEPGMYSASETFARKHGGKITQKILDEIPDTFRENIKKKGLNVNIDVRIHKLFPGMYPAIPDWHGDGEFKINIFGQQQLDQMMTSYHLITSISSNRNGVSNTCFLNMPIVAEIGECTPKVDIWDCVNKQIKELPQNKLKYKEIKDGELVSFYPDTLHKASECKNPGWRLFFRYSGCSQSNFGSGRLSKQEQVYIML